MRLFAALVALLALFSFPVAASPISLVNEALASKQVEKIDGRIYHTLSVVVPKSGPRIARYFSIVTDESGGLVGTAVSYEHWTVDAKGNWVIEEWEFLLSPDGKSAAFEHQIVHEQKDRLVLGVENLKTSKEAAASRLEKEMSFWLNRENV